MLKRTRRKQLQIIVVNTMGNNMLLPMSQTGQKPAMCPTHSVLSAPVAAPHAAPRFTIGLVVNRAVCARELQLFMPFGIRTQTSGRFGHGSKSRTPSEHPNLH